MSTRSNTNAPLDNPWQARCAVIESVTAETPGVATYRLRFRDPQDAQRYRFRPGQFNMLYIPGVGEIAISLSAAPQIGGAGDHTIRVVGNVTRRLAALAPGETLGVRGAFGVGWPVADLRGADVVIVAGGIGLAPLRSLIYDLISQRSAFGRISVLHGARTPDELLYSREYPSWEAAGVTVQTTVDRARPDWSGCVGVVTMLVDRLPLPNVPATALLMCGPEVMMKYVARGAIARGVSTARIWCALERNMQCAVGLCGHCQLGPEFICKDGPVFRYDRVASLLSVERL